MNARMPVTLDNTATTSIEQRYRRAEARTRLVADKHLLNTQVVPHWIDEHRFWYERQTSAGREFRLVNAQACSNEAAFDHRKLAEALQQALASDAPIKVDDLPLSHLMPCAEAGVWLFVAHKRHWRYDDIAGTCSEMPSRAKRPAFGVTSPDGTRIAFVRDHNLWLHDIADGTETALTTGGERWYSYGLAPEGARTAIGRPQSVALPQVVWAPDGRRLLSVLLDERKVRKHVFVDHAPADDSVHPQALDVRWATPGDAHVPEASFVCIDLESRRITRARHAPVPAVRMLDGFIDVGLAWFSADGNTAYFVDVERGERRADVVAFDTDTGRARVLFSEHTGQGWIELGAMVYTRTGVHALPSRNELVWYSERSGNAHLYRYDLASGTLLNAITAGEWRVCEVLAIDEPRAEVWFTASSWPGQPDPYSRVVCRASLAGGTPVVLAGDGDDHEVVCDAGMIAFIARRSGPIGDRVTGISPAADFFVETAGRIDTAPVSVLRDRDGRVLLTLEAADFSRIEGWRAQQAFELLAADGSTRLHGLLVHPSDFDPQRRYPLVDYIYGGPQVSHVPRAAMRSMIDQANLGEALALAELGFVVMLLDGRGTAMRDRRFHDHASGAVQRASDIDDHAAAIQQLAERHAYIDGERVGITGFSGGGFATAGAMLRRPDVFKVGVASSGNYDQRLFWHGWGERYHGLVDGDNYEAQSLKALANQLQGRLMFTHGLLDAGCPVSALFQLTDALSAANKDFELVLDARLGHERSTYATRRMWDFFVRHLAAEEPPAGIRLTLGNDVLKLRALAAAAEMETDKGGHG